MPPHHNKTPIPDSCTPENCSYERDKHIFIDSKLLKTAGVVISMLSPLFVWIVVSIFGIQSELQVAKVKIDSLMEIRGDIKTMTQDINTIKVDLATLKQKVEAIK